MSEFEIENRSEVQAGQNRFRSLQYKAKKSRAELEDYDLSNFNFIQESKSVREDTDAFARQFTDLLAKLLP